MPLGNLNILLGVSGGVAVYKAVDLASKLTAAGAKVITVMTESACRLVGPKSFEAVTRSAALTSMWEDGEPGLRPSVISEQPRHIGVIEWADIIVVAPATANIIGKTANGICDDLLSTVLCAATGLVKSRRVLMAPAMNNNMWDNPAVQRNVETAKQMGFQLVGPVKGRLASGIEGIGRMAEPRDILLAIDKIAENVQREQ